MTQDTPEQAALAALEEWQHSTGEQGAGDVIVLNDHWPVIKKALQAAQPQPVDVEVLVAALVLIADPEQTFSSETRGMIACRALCGDKSFIEGAKTVSLPPQRKGAKLPSDYRQALSAQGGVVDAVPVCYMAKDEYGDWNPHSVWASKEAPEAKGIVVYPLYAAPKQGGK